MFEFDLRGRPGFRMPFNIGDEVMLSTGGPRMTVVDFDEEGEVTVSWPSKHGRPSEMRMHHRHFFSWEGEK